MWFEALTGFREQDEQDVASRFLIDGEWMISTANGRSMRFGQFETPTLNELRSKASRISPTRSSGAISIRELVADVSQLHRDPGNEGACFQAASQFNALEMTGPSITPEMGVDRYESDRTQGPACAVACGAGTIFRNYLVDLPGGRGQSAARQVNCLADLAALLGVNIEMRNGYAWPSHDQLGYVEHSVRGLLPHQRDELLGRLRVGVQWDTEVTSSPSGHCVSQVYASALPIAYVGHNVQRWEPFARLVLDAAYEATLAVASINAAATGNSTVFLTLLGGGVFGNPLAWIVDSLKRATALYGGSGLDVRIVSHGRSNRRLAELLG